MLQGADSGHQYKVVGHEPQDIVVEKNGELREGNEGVGSSPGADAAGVGDDARNGGQRQSQWRRQRPR